MSLKNLISSLAICVVAIITGCKSSNNTVSEEDMIGVYKIDQFIPADSSKTFAQAEESKTWTMELMDKNNFEFKGDNKTVIGYWGFRKKEDNTNAIIFQSGYMPENVVYARFDKISLAFEQPLWMMDSLFQQVLLKRTNK